jgi:hypothetical protein
MLEKKVGPQMTDETDSRGKDTNTSFRPCEGYAGQLEMLNHHLYKRGLK